VVVPVAEAVIPQVQEVLQLVRKEMQEAMAQLLFMVVTAGALAQRAVLGQAVLVRVEVLGHQIPYCPLSLVQEILRLQPC
jgi:hypothetical protein